MASPDGLNMEEGKAATSPPVAPKRFPSVDAMRGLTVAAMLLVNNPGSWSYIYAPLQHAGWHGCTPTDLVFPFFLFIVGVSISLGIVSQVEAGKDPAPIWRALCIRAAKIIGIGLGLHLIIWMVSDWQIYFRPCGVLQRIGLCFLAVGALAMRSSWSLQVALIVVLLVGYWGLLGLTWGFEPWTNLASRVDTFLLGNLVYQMDAEGRGHDPEGLLSTLPAIATTLIGLHAGGWLRHGHAHRLLPGALGCLALGWLWAMVLPWNKNLWTPSFVMWTAGWAMAFLWLLHTLVDVRGWPAVGSAPGTNAITVYAGSALMVYLLAPSGIWSAYYRIVYADWMTPLFGDYVPSLAHAIVFTGVWWGIAKVMQRHGIVIKV